MKPSEMISQTLQEGMVSRVVARTHIRNAARLACSSYGRTASARRPLERALVAMGESLFLESVMHVAGVGNLLRKFKQIVMSATKFPKLWGRVKEFLGVESLGQLPEKLKELAKDGMGALKKVMHHIFQTLPMKLFTLPESKLFSVNSILERLMKVSPSFEKFIGSHVKPHVEQFDLWLKERVPTISKVVLVGIYIFIWVNVAEFEWDLKSLLEALSGQLSLFDLLSSLPGSVLGLLINMTLGSGTFTFLPIALVARLSFVIGMRYVDWTGSGFKFDWAKLQKDFNIEPSALSP